MASLRVVHTHSLNCCTKCIYIYINIPKPTLWAGSVAGSGAGSCLKIRHHNSTAFAHGAVRTDQTNRGDQTRIMREYVCLESTRDPHGIASKTRSRIPDKPSDFTYHSPRVYVRISSSAISRVLVRFRFHQKERETLCARCSNAVLAQSAYTPRCVQLKSMRAIYLWGCDMLFCFKSLVCVFMYIRSSMIEYSEKMRVCVFCAWNI